MIVTCVFLCDRSLTLQRLIYMGRVLRDQQTLESYGELSVTKFLKRMSRHQRWFYGTFGGGSKTPACSNSKCTKSHVECSAPSQSKPSLQSPSKSTTVHLSKSICRTDKPHASSIKPACSGYYSICSV